MEAGLEGQRSGVEASVGDLPGALRRGFSAQHADGGASAGESGGLRQVSGAVSGENSGPEDRGGVLRGSTGGAEKDLPESGGDEGRGGDVPPSRCWFLALGNSLTNYRI